MYTTGVLESLVTPRLRMGVVYICNKRLGFCPLGFCSHTSHGGGSKLDSGDTDWSKLDSGHSGGSELDSGHTGGSELGSGPLVTTR